MLNSLQELVIAETDRYLKASSFKCDERRDGLKTYHSPDADLIVFLLPDKNEDGLDIAAGVDIDISMDQGRLDFIEGDGLTVFNNPVAHSYVNLLKELIARRGDASLRLAKVEVSPIEKKKMTITYRVEPSYG